MALGIPQNSYRTATCERYLTNSTPIVLANTDVMFGNLSNCWGAMPLFAGTSVSDADYETVSSLMVYLGLKLRAQYGAHGTAASLSDIPSVFVSNYSINCSCANVNFSTIVNQVYSQHKPVIMSFYRTENGASFGHAVVVDGYKKVTDEYRYVYKTMTPETTYYKYLYEVKDYEYLSINWGYEGTGDVSPSTGDVIWYNLQSSFTLNSRTYDQMGVMVYNFRRVS